MADFPLDIFRDGFAQPVQPFRQAAAYRHQQRRHVTDVVEGLVQKLEVGLLANFAPQTGCDTAGLLQQHQIRRKVGDTGGVAARKNTADKIFGFTPAG